MSTSTSITTINNTNNNNYTKSKLNSYIDEKIDAALKHIGPSKAYAIKATRTGMYYILVKEHLMNLYNAKNDA